MVTHDMQQLWRSTALKASSFLLWYVCECVYHCMQASHCALSKTMLGDHYLHAMMLVQASPECIMVSDAPPGRHPLAEQPPNSSNTDCHTINGMQTHCCSCPPGSQPCLLSSLCGSYGLCTWHCPMGYLCEKQKQCYPQACAVLSLTLLQLAHRS